MKLAPPDVGDDNNSLSDRVTRALVEERDRIAHDLDAALIQRLLGVALHLQGTITLLDGRAADRVAEAVEELDSLVTEVRTVIFGMATCRREPGNG
ncbi:MAG TPA: hypothetical protein VFH38_04505 [Jatrophihabitans sp.]|nr:hypothetical protein [Jatrophihabitans sp.]